MSTFDAVMNLLRRRGQEHLLAFHNELAPAEQAGLLEQIQSINFDQLDGLIQSHVLASPALQIPKEISPAPMLPAVPKDPAETSAYAAARQRGEQAIASGKVAAMVVAGGDGTRLGFAGPKGCLPVTPVKHKGLFQVFAEQILATRRRYNCAIPWYIMTSPSNDAATRECFQKNKNFGLPAEDVYFFAQGRMPAIGLDGKIILADKGQIAFNPDGHGGSLTALRRSGALYDMARREIDVISYFQVDNPLVRAIDPLFIGLHLQAGAQMSAKALPKREPLEKLGNFCMVDGKIMVIEYSDLPQELAYATRPNGTLQFSAGSIAIHLFSRTFVEQLTAGGECRLPFHRAVKKVGYLADTGVKIQPDEPNAVKLEMFVFDALPLAAQVVILETLRSEEFSPVKNSTGDDSLSTCLHDQVRRAAMWLESVGVRIPRDATGRPAAAIEISPLLALEAKDLQGKLPTETVIKTNTETYLE